MRDMQMKVLEWIETVVSACNDTDTSLELLVNYSRGNSGQMYVQPTDCFFSIIECAFIFESRYAAFDFGGAEIQMEYARPETVLRVVDRFRSAVASYIKEHRKKTATAAGAI